MLQSLKATLELNPLRTNSVRGKSCLKAADDRGQDAMAMHLGLSATLFPGHGFTYTSCALQTRHYM